ncbi:MAG: transposase [Chitinophagaceae bacterium]
MKYPKSLQELMQSYSAEKACIKFLEEERWPGGKIRCPHCDHDRIYCLKYDGCYKCANNKCYKKFSRQAMSH